MENSETSKFVSFFSIYFCLHIYPIMRKKRLNEVAWLKNFSFPRDQIQLKASWSTTFYAIPKSQVLTHSWNFFVSPGDESLVLRQNHSGLQTPWGRRKDVPLQILWLNSQSLRSVLTKAMSDFMNRRAVFKIVCVRTIPCTVAKIQFCRLLSNFFDWSKTPRS